MGNCFGIERNNHHRLINTTNMYSAQVLQEDLPPPYEEGESSDTIDARTNSPGSSLLTDNMSEEQQVRLAQRLGLIQHLPCGIYDGTKKKRECVICMSDFCIGDSIRFLPCLHIYHQQCIDDWLLRSFTCPFCAESIDAALISTFYTSE